MVKIRDLNNRDYRTLLVFQKSMEWVEQVRIAAETLPDEGWEFAKKMLRASSRVPTLMASGNSQFYLTIERESYRKALNKAKEVQGLIETGFNSGYICEQDFEALNEKTDELGMMLNAMRKKIAGEIEGKQKCHN
ncbi:four helix bundle protein [Paenibacillus sp. JTLBN-2024]